MHALIVGDRGVGKSTLIHRVLSELNSPVFGFETKKETALEDPVWGCPIFIYDAGKPHVQNKENFLGYNKGGASDSVTAAFERYAPKLRSAVPSGYVVELDEIGFLEARSEAFCAAVMDLLDGDAPVIAAVKDRSVPFLDQVRSHPKARCFYITRENRDELTAEVLFYLKQQLEASV